MIQIDRKALWDLHLAFEHRMAEQSGGVPFTGFSHPFLVRDEIAYKYRVASLASDALRYREWGRKSAGSGRILQAVRRACSPAVSANLLEHRFGPKGGSAQALYRVTTRRQIAELESQLYAFFRGGGTSHAEFGTRFQALADYLRAESLGCNWAFMAYLAFAYAPDRYFPIRPAAFERLLRYLGVDSPLSGHVSWDRYATVLAVADALREELAVYGGIRTIEIQSYMWVLSYLLDSPRPRRAPASSLDLSETLERRVQRARERERIGLAGEAYARKSEHDRLARSGRSNLARRVRLVSEDDSSLGYDLLSFELSGKERHIEVKTTARDPSDDPGFYLSETERAVAAVDSFWTVARVSNIDSEPTLAFLGNVVNAPDLGWQMSPASWLVTRC
jgi:hypothetical protein